MASASSSLPPPPPAAQELDDRDKYLQELILGSMLDPPSSSSSGAAHRRVRPLTDDEIGWFYCEVCFERKLVFDRFRVDPSGVVCPHAFCVACVVAHIEARVAEGRVPVPCLLGAYGCPRGGVLHPEACKKLLDIDVFDRWCVALCERAVGPARARCPYRDCGEMAVLDDAAAVRARVAKASCPTCSRAFCLQCEEPWDERHGGGDGEARCALTQLAKGREWRRCPSCRAMIDKIDGCKHMTCRCGTQFCYDCGSTFKPRKYSCKCTSRSRISSEPKDDSFIDLTCSGRQLHLGNDC